MNAPPRKPIIFDPADRSLNVTEREAELKTEIAISETTKPTLKESDDEIANSNLHPPRSTSALITWGGLLLTSLLGLLALWASTSLIEGITALFRRNDALGWLAVSLAIIATLSLAALIARELLAIRKLKKLATLNSLGKKIHLENKSKPARNYLARIKSLYKDRPNRRWYLDRIRTKENEIMDGREVLEMIDTELGAPLDREARTIISTTAKKVSLITAIAPGPILDMAAVTVLNIRMIRKIAEVYGVRPGFFGQIKLARNVITHLALSGGIAVTSDLLSPLIGTSIAAKLSKRLGEGLFNGALTIRIGLSAIELTRPMPYIKEKRLSFAALVTSSLTPRRDKSNKADV